MNIVGGAQNISKNQLNSNVSLIQTHVPVTLDDLDTRQFLTQDIIPVKTPDIIQSSTEIVIAEF